MNTDGGDKIIKTMKKVCKDQKNCDEYFNILKTIYNHISNHENEPSESRAISIKNIIDSKMQEEWVI